MGASEPEFVCDVLVAGSGAAGLAAAVALRHGGLDVIVAEKAPCFGGTTAISGGEIWIPGNDQARGGSFVDSADSAFRYLEAAPGGTLDPVRARAYVEEAANALRFFEVNSHARFVLFPEAVDYYPDCPGAAPGGRTLRSEPFDGRRLGARFRALRHPLPVATLLGGLSIAREDLPHLLNLGRSPRSMLYVARLLGRYGLDRLSGLPRGSRTTMGNALAARLALTLFEREVPLWLGAPVVALEAEGGRVTGAVVKRGGARVVVRARKAVILACGGFPGSDTLKRRHYPHLAGEGATTHVSIPPGENAGDGLALAESLGAVLERSVRHPAAWTPVSLAPVKGGGTTPFPHFGDRAKPGVIAVLRDGRRFTNEASSYHDFVAAMIASAGTRPVEAFLITDARAIRAYGLGRAPSAPRSVEPHVRSGYLVRAGSLGELAGRIGIDGRALEATVAAYNGPARDGADPAFGKGGNGFDRAAGDAAHRPNPCVAPLETPPFYALRVLPGDIGTFLGLKVDATSRVLDSAGAAIPGLYAIGNDAASLMGGGYPGAGITLGPALTFGYLAARAIAGT